MNVISFYLCIPSVYSSFLDWCSPGYFHCLLAVGDESLKTSLKSLCYKIFCLCVFLYILWFQVLYIQGFGPFLVDFDVTVCEIRIYFHSFACSFSVFQTLYWRGYLYSSVCFWLLCHRLTVCFISGISNSISFYFKFYFYFIVSIFVPVPGCFNYCGFII